MEEEISLKEIFDLIKRNMRLIVIFVLAAVAISTIVTIFLIDPKYESTTQILVNQSSNETNDIDTNQIQASVQLIETYSEIIVSDTIINESLEQMDAQQFTIPEIRELIEVTSNSNSQIFSIDVTSEDPQFSAELANTLANTFSDNIGDMFEVNNVSILTPAKVETDPVSPNLILNVLIASIVGLGLALIFVFVREALDTTIKDPEYFREVDILLLGSVNELSNEEIEDGRYERPLASPSANENLPRREDNDDVPRYRSRRVQ